jgi:cell division protein FtsB
VTPVRISVAASITSVLLLLIVLELIRGRRLKERYALLWLVTGVVLFVLSAWRGGLNTIASWLGVSTYPPAILFAAATLFVIVLLLHYSTVLSELHDRNVVLAQRVALLEERLQALSTGSPPRPEETADDRSEQGSTTSEASHRGRPVAPS